MGKKVCQVGTWMVLALCGCSSKSPSEIGNQEKVGKVNAALPNGNVVGPIPPLGEGSFPERRREHYVVPRAFPNDTIDEAARRQAFNVLMW